MTLCSVIVLWLKRNLSKQLKKKGVKCATTTAKSQMVSNDRFINNNNLLLFTYAVVSIKVLYKDAQRE